MSTLPAMFFEDTSTGIQVGQEPTDGYRGRTSTTMATNTMMGAVFYCSSGSYGIFLSDESWRTGKCPAPDLNALFQGELFGCKDNKVRIQVKPTPFYGFGRCALCDFVLWQFYPNLSNFFSILIFDFLVGVISCGVNSSDLRNR